MDQEQSAAEHQAGERSHPHGAAAGSSPMSAMEIAGSRSAAFRTKSRRKPQTNAGASLLEVNLRIEKYFLTCNLQSSSFKKNYKVVATMPHQPKLGKLELRILEALWTRGKASIRDIHGLFPEPRPAYTTVQTIVYRMEAKHALRRVERVGNADFFEPLVSRDLTRNRVLDEILSFFGGRAAPLMAQLADAGKLTPDDVRELENTLRKLKARQKEESK